VLELLEVYKNNKEIHMRVIFLLLSLLVNVNVDADASGKTELRDLIGKVASCHSAIKLCKGPKVMACDGMLRSPSYNAFVTRYNKVNDLTDKEVNETGGTQGLQDLIEDVMLMKKRHFETVKIITQEKQGIKCKI
jgi:hypothetical protein